MTSSAGRLLDELADLVRPAASRLLRWLPRFLIGLALTATLLGVLVLIGAAQDDASIDAHRGLATADVLDGSGLARTLVRFATTRGDTVVPENGVFYPRGLQAGQSVQVEYDTTNPDLVRVAGGSFTQGMLPVAAWVVLVWVIALGLRWWLRARRRMSTPSQAGPSA